MKTYLLTLVLILLGTMGFSVTHKITNAGNTFSPASITINLGDTVNFSISNMHNAVEVSQATYDAKGTTPLPGFSVPFSGGLVLPDKLTAGTHYYVCTPHASIGMIGIIIVKDPTEIVDNLLKTNISIFPNPSNGVFQLEADNSQYERNYNLDIYNLLGDKVYTKPGLGQQNSYEIDLTILPKGIYFLKINDGVQLYSKKIVIK
jgi:plastocyanin